jgi:uncharacterized protein YjdB
MSFTYKLSRRLALLFLFVACEKPLGVAPPPEVAQIIVFPKTTIAQANQDVTFTSVALSAQGDTANVVVVWSASGGSVTDLGSAGGRHFGRYRNASCGNYLVVASVLASDGMRADTARVNVMCAVATVAVSPPSSSLPVGDSVRLTATPKDPTGTPITGRYIGWSSSDPLVANVSSTGLVTGMAEGTATISATVDTVTGTATVVVTPIPVASVEVVPPSDSVAPGSTVQLTATTRDAKGNALGGRAISWSTSDATIATVDQNGLVSGVSPGLATITATSESKSGSAAIKVTAP